MSQVFSGKEVSEERKDTYPIFVQATMQFSILLHF